MSVLLAVMCGNLPQLVLAVQFGRAYGGSDRKPQPRKVFMSTARSKSADVLIAEAARTGDPVVRLRRVAAARAAHNGTNEKLAAATEDAIAIARHDSFTWPYIGEILGVSAQRAQQLSRRPVTA